METITFVVNRTGKKEKIIALHVLVSHVCLKQHTVVNKIQKKKYGVRYDCQK